MISSKRRTIFWISGITLLLCSSLSYFVFAGTGTISGTVSLQINGVGLRHGTPNNVNLGTPNTSPNDQEIVGQFDDNFWVEDLEGYITGHYTTIQCDGVYGSAGNKLTGVYLKVGNSNPTLLMGGTGNVHIATELDDYVSILTPITYIYKPTAINNQGVINRYGDKPRLKIIIPGGTPPGSYSGTIVFNLYMY